MQLTDFNYELPDELIARYPLPLRSASRLMCLNQQSGQVTHQQFTDFVDLLQPNDLLVFNNTRVIPARLMGHKPTGGQVEVLVERLLDDKRILAHLRASKKPKPNTLLHFANQVIFEVVGRHHELFELRLQSEHTILDTLDLIGEVPIPPYFNRDPDDNDKLRYQTIYAEHKGSVAAPTAGLHFDETIFAKLREKNIELGYVMLHVGAGTFAPVRVDDITQHRMHAEYIEVSSLLCQQVEHAKARGGRVIAIGTTSVRCLETASQTGHIKPYTGDTDIFIYPGYKFKCVDAMLTNFHLPCSTLLMLVAAKAGYESTMAAYREAVLHQYRFFSYGDAMFIA